MTDLSQEAQDAVDKVQKLLRLAAKNPNEHEAAAATAKAQELLTAYNLDMATVEQASGGKSKRADEKMSGGLYKYQRDLWQAVAGLNFCLYWNQYAFDPDKTGRSRSPYDGSIVKRKGGYRFEHRVVGRQVNVVATRHMAEYLEQTIERLTRERLHGDGTQFFTRWAINFREGMAAKIIEKVNARRRKTLSAERRARAAAQAAATAAGRDGASTATALTLSTYIDSETDANLDFIHGEGYSARKAANRAAQAKARAEADAEYTKWAAANPEEAARDEAKRHKERRRSSWNAGMKEDKRDHGAYYSGYDAGAGVSIDPQMDGGRKGGLLK